ncbi:Eukaryotic/viral aspartic protease [Phytophthora megakarya]|uniref:Eukaryotic/viral aspartic protease n=1 Tax=Phytophthora megakarya TaxID=4795 RepID=A0A225VDA1_9STRA|nr:Eukaryotic/viral aspartic protease [Phytophthora megakarya]
MWLRPEPPRTSTQVDVRPVRRSTELKTNTNAHQCSTGEAQAQEKEEDESVDEPMPKTGSKDTAKELEYELSHFSKRQRVRNESIKLFPPFRTLHFHNRTASAEVKAQELGRDTTPIQDRKPKTRPALPPPEYVSNEDSDSSVESPKRMPMRRPPRVMQLAATPAEPEAPSAEGRIPKPLEDAIVRMMQSTRMQTKPETTSSAPRYANPTPASRRTTTDTVPEESTDVALESVSSRSLSCSKRDQDEDPDDPFDLGAGLTGTAAAVSTATAGAGVARVRLSAFSELKEFNGKDASEEKASAWFNGLKAASRRDGMTGDEVCALFGDLMAGPASQWYLQLKKSTRTPWTELTDQFRIQYCGMRAKIHYSGGTPEERHEHVELFMNTLGAQEQELASRLTLMEVPDTATLEKKLRARQRGLTHQKKTLFGSNRFRPKASAPMPTPTRAVHAVQIATDDYDSGREGDSDEDQIYDQDREDEERAKLFVTGHTPQQENARRDFDTGGAKCAGQQTVVFARAKRVGTYTWLGNALWRSSSTSYVSAVLLLDTGAEVSILDTTFAREVGCQIDTSVTQEFVGIRDETSFTVGKTRVKVTPAGNMKVMHRPEETQNGRVERRQEQAAVVAVISRGDTSVAAATTPTRDAHSPKPGGEPYLETEQGGGPRPVTGSTDGPNELGVNFENIPEYEHADEEVIFHEGLDLFAEDVEAEMAVLPEAPLTAEVKIEDLKIGRPEGVDPKEAEEMKERLRQNVWEKRKWVIGKGNALPPAAKGVICDIDVGNARPVAHRVRKISLQFREKLADLIRGLLSARMIRASKSPWASPIVVIVKKNGVDMRLCVDYRLVNGLTQLMVYPMPLVTDLLENLDKYRWYCSLDIASGFWKVPMTDRARLISAFVTPFGLFEWLRMPFGLCNAPQIYQWLIDNALYGFWKQSPTENTRDVFKDGIPSKPGTRSVLGRRSYIDHILIGGTTWDDLCKKVERLLEVCEEWNLSISVEKSEWGMSKVDYLGDEVSEDGLGAKLKNLETLATLEFPQRVSNPETRDLDKWIHAERAFDTLRSKIATTPM